MFVWSFFWFLLLISSLNMATRGKATKFTVEKAMLMLDSSFSGSELEGFESDDSLDGYWQNEENEQEAGCTDGGASHDSGVAEGETSTEPELTLADGGASHDSGVAEGETSTEPELTLADGGASHDSGGAEGETSAEPELTLADLLEETVKGNKLEGRFSISMSPVCL